MMVVAMVSKMVNDGKLVGTYLVDHDYCFNDGVNDD